MKIVGYVVWSEDFKQEFSKGFLNKSMHLISSYLGAGIIPPWKASDLYDGVLNRTAAMIAVGRYDSKDPDKNQSVWEKILDLCERNQVGAIIAKGVPLAEHMPYPAFDGSVCRLAQMMLSAIKEEVICRDTELGVCVGPSTDTQLIEFLCQRFNYMRFYCNDTSIAHEARELAYMYNGTATEVVSSIGKISASDAAIILDPRASVFSDKLRSPLVVDPFRSGRHPAMPTTMFTEKLGEITLGEDYYEAMHYCQRGLRPEDDFERFSFHLESLLYSPEPRQLLGEPLQLE
ncbi:MAG: hypothetical protein FWG10_05625 [Eubacteriaceae bacterium]|nr:hypothetical protein [Eubacteriaceae bacterium]